MLPDMVSPDLSKHHGRQIGAVTILERLHATAEGLASGSRLNVDERTGVEQQASLESHPARRWGSGRTLAARLGQREHPGGGLVGGLPLSDTGLVQASPGLRHSDWCGPTPRRLPVTTTTTLLDMHRSRSLTLDLIVSDFAAPTIHDRAVRRSHAAASPKQ